MIDAVMAHQPIPPSFVELDEQVSIGLPKGALKACIDPLYVSAQDRQKLLYRIIPEAAYKRRRETLFAKESASTERLARSLATAAYVWNSDEDARLFLTTPHSMLQGPSPLDASPTELGARRIEELLFRLYYGIAA